MLKAKVVGVESGDVFTDGKPRLRLRFQGADSPFNELRIHAAEGVKLGDEMVFSQNEQLVPEITISQAHDKLRARYPGSSINVTMEAWRYADHSDTVSVQFRVSILPGPTSQCDQFNAGCLMSCVRKAIEAGDTATTTVEEADAICADRLVHAEAMPQV